MHQKPQGDEFLKPGSRRDGVMTGHSGLEAPLHDEAKQFLTTIWVIFRLSMGPALAIGLARFAHALLLPSMRADLGWSFADSGSMNTANSAEYIIGALVAAHIGRCVGDKAVFPIGLLGAGLTANFTSLLLLRARLGLAGAVAFVRRPECAFLL
jgi:predicted MFS family arabinose efflux permease